MYTPLGAWGVYITHSGSGQAHLHHGLLLSIPLFRDISDMCRDDFVLDIWQMLLPQVGEREFFIDNLLARMHGIKVMIR